MSQLTLIAGGAPVRYPIPWGVVARLIGAVWFQLPRHFRADAQSCVASLHQPLQVIGIEHAPTAGPCLITVNHFSRPGFRAWWIPLAVSAAVPADVHWVMTRAWRFHNRRRTQVLLAPAFRWLLGRVGRVYSFTTMPAMPPEPAEVIDRARAVRELLSYTRRTPRPLIGLAPEGQDSAAGQLTWPPPGAGRLVDHLARAGLAVAPVGVFEADGRLYVRFGPTYDVGEITAQSTADRDCQVSRVVMSHIAALLPRPLRGDFA